MGDTGRTSEPALCKKRPAGSEFLTALLKILEISLGNHLIYSGLGGFPAKPRCVVPVRREHPAQAVGISERKGYHSSNIFEIMMQTNTHTHRVGQRYGRKGLLAVLFTACAGWLQAQDIHFAQFYNVPLALNPALTGVSAGDIRLTGVYRSQWQAADAPYRTFQNGVEKKFYVPRHDTWWLSAGMSMSYDRAGDGNLSTTNISLSGSLTRKLDDENFLTLGLAAGVGQRHFEFGNFTFDNQWVNDVFCASCPTNEIFDINNITYPDVSVGVNWRGQQKRRRTKLDVGLGLFHFNQPDQNYLPGDYSPLPRRFSLYMLPTLQVTPSGDVVANLSSQLQGGYFEALAGFGFRYHLSTRRSQEMALQLGVGYRFNAIGDALTPALEIHFRDLLVGFSWDVNVSGFSTATNRNGGPELSMRYLFHKVYPIRAFKACPLI
ncbi:MAG: hypothetical protein RLY31_340 [Bacteroidota bacterium]